VITDIKLYIVVEGENNICYAISDFRLSKSTDPPLDGSNNLSSTLLPKHKCVNHAQEWHLNVNWKLFKNRNFPWKTAKDLWTLRYLRKVCNPPPNLLFPAYIVTSYLLYWCLNFQVSDLTLAMHSCIVWK